LSDMAARHASSLDVSRPSEGTAAAPRRPAEPARSEPASRPAPPPTGTAAGPAGDERAGWISDLLKRASGTGGRTPAASAQELPPAPAPAPAAADAPATPKLTESLNALSADIARAIDMKAFGELWARHNKGER